MGESVLTSVQPIQPRWLRLKDATAYSAIGQKRLIALAKGGKVIGWQDSTSRRGAGGKAAEKNGPIVGEWIFDRFSLDEYRLDQYRPPEVEHAADEALRRLGLLPERFQAR